MQNQFFVIGLALVLGALLAWAVRNLPKENWQIVASIPTKKSGTNHWQGLNLTFYGFFTANALLISSLMFFVMLGAVGLETRYALLVLAPLLSVCLPAAHLVARWVEKKKATFTIGGASFLGIILAPWLIVIVQGALGGGAQEKLQVLPVMAALSVCYALGEGLGRLACLSFGCCYGRKLSDCPAWVQRFFKRHHLVFEGITKKVAYEGGLSGVPVFPVQAVTYVISIVAGLAGLYLFLLGWFTPALLVSLSITQLWRVYSETLRADYRGGRKFSAYQWMALSAIPYAWLMVLLFPMQRAALPSLMTGLESVRSIEVVLGLQALWWVALIYTGSSKVTASRMEIFVVQDNI